MKNLSFLISAAALLSASSSLAAIDCGTLPSCESLGFTQSKSECKDKYQLCPFDKNKAVCIDSPAVGDIKHSLKDTNHDGWLLCNGQPVSKTTYSALYGIIGTNYGGSGDNFNVPDYRGYFLRGYTAQYTYPNSAATGSYNNSLTSPQKEQLPNIKGEFPLDTNATKSGKVNKAFSVVSGTSGAWSGAKTGKGCLVNFSASAKNSIYNGSHVIPGNYATHIFIYAGQ